jgi:hypothetical protein
MMQLLQLTTLKTQLQTALLLLHALIDTSREVDLEANEERTKYMLLFCHQIVRQNHDTKVANRSLENIAQFKFWKQHNKLTTIQSKTFYVLVCCQYTRL